MNAKKATVAAIAALALCAPLFAGDATWNYRSGVGDSPANPTLWTDADNWQGGTPPSGDTAVATFTADASHATETVWVKLPDDAVVTLGKMDQKANSPKFRFIGGQGFYFVGTSSAGVLLNADAASRSIVYSPVTVKYYLELRGFDLACPMTFERTTSKQISFYYPNSVFRNTYYAYCGGEEREFCPGLEYLQPRHQTTFAVPNNNNAHTGAWAATAGSKLLKWVSGTKGLSLAVGQYVHAAGVIPEGAYVERLYTDDYIEISEPALASSADPSAGTSIAFDRCYYKLTQHLKSMDFYGSQGVFSVQRTTAENAATFLVDKLVDTGTVLFAYPGHAYWGETEAAIDNYPQPAVVQIADTSIFTGGIGVRSGYLSFTNTVPGSADFANLKFYDSASYRQYGRCVFDTAAGVTSTVASCANQWYGTIGKKGAGAMSVTTSIAAHYRLRVYEGLFTLNPTAENSTMDKVTVKDGGTFRLAENRELTVSTLVVESGGRISLAPGATLPAPATLTFAAGGIVRVEEGATFDASTWSLPDGTIFEGPGVVTGLSAAKIKACTFRDGAKVRVSGAEDNLLLSGTTSTNLPTRISPAFWVSAKAADSIIKGDNDHPNLITRWNDCRGTSEQGYHFATNAMAGGFQVSGNYYPMLQNSQGIPLVMMRRSSTAITGPADSPALVWDAPITGIKAVFAIVAGQYDNQNGGGSLLGSTERLATCDFYRNVVYAWYGDRFETSATKLRDAPYYVNGHLPPDGETLAGSVRAKPMLVGCFPQLVDVHPTGEGAEADCWGYQNAAINRYGAWIGECIIYTNAVTEVERRQIENYLMEKWFGSRVIGAEVVPAEQDMTGVEFSGASVDVGAGDAVSFAVYTNAAGLVKTGAGAAYVKGLHTAGTLAVRGGTLHVESHDATDASVLPDGAVLHVDANDDDSFPDAVATEVEGEQGVATWRDVRGNDLPFLQRQNSGYGLPVRKTVSAPFAQPMKVVDYGAFHNSLDDDWNASGGWYGATSDSVFHRLKQGSAATNATGLTSVFAVWGTAAGGNQLLGGYETTYGLDRDVVVSSDVAGNVAKPIMAGANSQRSASQSNIGYESLAFLNGRKVVPVDAAPSGSFDVVSILSPYAMHCASIGCQRYRTKVGGLAMGELILYRKMLTSDEAKRVDAYLNCKWFGREPTDPALTPASVGALEVASGATVAVEGNAPLVCSALTGAGTVSGDVALAADALIEVPVNADGSITQVLTVSGAADLTNGGTLDLAGYADSLADGSYLLIACPSVYKDGAWAVTGYTGSGKQLKLRAAADGLRLDVKRLATMLIVR